MRHIKRLLYISLTFMLLAGCGLNVGAIRSIDATKTSSPDKGIVIGKVHFIVDGEDLNYNIFKRPLMRLFRASNGQYYETPMVDSSGAFSWLVPEGEYEIAVLFGGMSPVGVPMLMRDRGQYWRVNGFTYPGYRFFAMPGKIHYLGTLAVYVNSKKMSSVINITGERVFDSLDCMRIIDESAIEPRWQTVKDMPGAVVELFESVSYQTINKEKN